MKRKLFIVLLSICMVLSLQPAVAMAAVNFPDMPAKDHWSYKALSAAIDNGLLQGGGGRLMPGDSLTRAQLAAFLNRAFGAVSTADISGYADVKSTDWYYADIAKAVRMGTLAGDSGLMHPEREVTREQAFTALARALKLPDGVLSSLDVFSDKSAVSPWAAPALAAMVQAGYIQGADGRLEPAGIMTREQFAQVMYNVFARYISAAGTYTESAGGNVLVSAGGVTLQELTISGDLILGEGVGNGDVTLDGVTVTGRVVIRGGGANSIRIINKTNVGSVIVGKTGDGGVRVRTEEGCHVEVVYIDDGLDDIILEGTFNQVSVHTDAPVVLRDATVTDLTVSGAGAVVSLGGTTTVSMTQIKQEAAGAKLEVGDGAMVTKLESTADGVTISGGGTVTQAVVNGNNTAVDTQGTKVTVEDGATGVTQNGDPVGPGTPSIPPGVWSPYYTASVASEIEMTAALTNTYVTAIHITGSFTLTDRATYTDADIWTKPVTVSSGVTLNVGHNRSLYIESTLVNNGTIQIAGAATADGDYGVLAIRSGGICTNNGTVTLDGASASDTGPNGAALRLLDATLVNNGTITSTAGSDPTYWGGFIAVVNTSTLTNNQSIALNGMSLLVIEAEATAAGSATVYNSAGAELTASDMACKIEIRDGGAVETHGTMTSAGDLVIGAAAAEDIDRGGSLIIEDGTVTNSGTITVQGNGVNAMAILGRLVNTASGTINNNNARINMIGTLDNSGTVNNSVGSEFFVQDCAEMSGLGIDNSMTALVFSEEELQGMMTKGYLHLRLEADIELDSDLTVAAGMTLTVDTGKTLTVASGVSVIVQPGGGLVNNGAISNSGIITIQNGASFSGNAVTGGTFSDEN